MDQGSSSSSSTSRVTYQVFLSFSGKDTRKGFTDFLYADLVDAEIRTFRDDDELHIGEAIGTELFKAIKESKISILIFSKNYASSIWCLRELTQIVECHTNDGQIIFPIFYNVKPSEVRHQSGSYENAFCLHEKNFDEMMVQGWKLSMKKVGQLKGYELERETNGHEGELVKKVVREVLLALKKNYMLVPENLVGMDGHVKAMNELLNLDCNGIRVVGIHGMGGLGKTTIAKFMYNQICDGFESCCFLEDVRANSNTQNVLVNLQTQLLSKIRKGEVGIIDNVDQGIKQIKDAVGMKKVLIVLDDVDDKDQLDKLVGKCSWFGPGSRIIVTTRNKEVLENLKDVYGTYEPPLMNSSDSLELFRASAFMRDSPREDELQGHMKLMGTLAQEFISSAIGLPLVLVTVGSLLSGMKDKALWEEKLTKLEEILHEQQHILLEIYKLYQIDGINPTEYDEFYPIDDDKPRMHDHLRELNNQIVTEENMSKPRKHSRL